MFCPSMVIAPPLHFVKAQQQVEHRRLAAARGADQRGYLAGLGGKRHAAQHGLVRAIEETHVGGIQPAPW
jgi:hypothetical protein